MDLDRHLALLDKRQRVLLKAGEKVRLVRHRARAECRPPKRRTFTEENANVGLLNNRTRQESQVNHPAIKTEYSQVPRKVVLADEINNHVNSIGNLLDLLLVVLRPVVDGVEARIAAREVVQECYLLVCTTCREDLVGAADVDLESVLVHRW
jgi:hypothetical protein